MNKCNVCVFFELHMFEVKERVRQFDRQDWALKYNTSWKENEKQVSKNNQEIMAMNAWSD